MRALLAVLATVLVACGSTPAAVRPPASYVPWLPLPDGHLSPTAPAPGTPPPVPPGTPYCTAGQLEGKLIGYFSAMSNPDTPIALRNASRSPCFLEGFPDLTIADRFGRVLARVSRADAPDGIGTYFDSTTTPVAVLMTPGTAQLSGDSNFGDGQGLPPGQAFFNVEWLGCTTQPAASVRIDLPGGAGRLTIPFDVTPNGPDLCNRDWPLTRGPFDPTGISWSPDRHLLKVGISISTPQTSVRRGATLDYFVTLTNSSSENYPLRPCPDYWEADLALKTSDFSYELNCGPAGTIAAGASVTFQMKMAISPDTPVGSSTILWGLFDGRITTDSESASAPITIT